MIGVGEDPNPCLWLHFPLIYMGAMRPTGIPTFAHICPRCEKVVWLEEKQTRPIRLDEVTATADMYEKALLDEIGWVS